jgi:hypothetical protein
MTNHKHVKCVCDLHDMMRNGCPSARGLPCRSAPRTLRDKMNAGILEVSVKKPAPVTRASVKDSAERVNEIALLECKLKSAPQDERTEDPLSEYCKSCLASSDDTLFCNKEVANGLCEECLVSKIENDDVAMSALRRLVDKGYTEDEILAEYRKMSCERVNRDK